MDLLFKENFISTKEASKSSGYTSDYIARLIRSGKIVGQKIGHSWFVDRDSLHIFLADKNKQQKDTTVVETYLPPVVYPAEDNTSLPVSPNAQKIRDKIREISEKTNTPSPQVLVTGGFFNHVFALSVALFVVASGAYGAQLLSSSHVTDRIATIAQQTAEGFALAFGTFPTQMVARMGTTVTAEYAIASAGVPLFSGYRYTPIAFSSVDIALPHSFSNEAYRTTHTAAPVSFKAPHLTIQGTVAATSAFFIDTAIALAHGATGLAHLAIGSDVSFAYGVATIAPQSAQTATLFLIATGTLLEGGVAHLPALAVSTYKNATTLPAIWAPTLAQTVYETEYMGIHHLVAFAGNLSVSNVTNTSRAMYLGVGSAFASVGVATERIFGSMPLTQ